MLRHRGRDERSRRANHSAAPPPPRRCGLAAAGLRERAPPPAAAPGIRSRPPRRRRLGAGRAAACREALGLWRSTGTIGAGRDGAALQQLITRRVSTNHNTLPAVGVAAELFPPLFVAAALLRALRVPEEDHLRQREARTACSAAAPCGPHASGAVGHRAGSVDAPGCARRSPQSR